MLAPTLVQFVESLVFLGVLIYQFINELIKYSTPDVNKYIVYLPKLIP